MAKADPNPNPLRIVPVSCLKLCPQDAVVVCTQHELAKPTPGLHILRTRQDIATLYESCKPHAVLD